MVGYVVGATMGIGPITLRSFAKQSVITGIDHTETVSDPMTGDMNIRRGPDDKTYSRERRRGPKMTESTRRRRVKTAHSM